MELMPSLFYKSIIPRISLPLKGQIILSNLLSGDYSVVVYYHDGKSYSVANFVLKLLDLGIYLWMILLYVVLISIILYIYYKWNKMLYPKIKIKRRGTKASKNDSRNGIKSGKQIE
jgi:uncharacterized membrane protein